MWEWLLSPIIVLLFWGLVWLVDFVTRRRSMRGLGAETSAVDEPEYFRRSVVAYCPLPAGRMVILSELSESDFTRIGTGVVFLHANYSGKSIRALQTLSGVLHDTRLERVRLFIADIAYVNLRFETYQGVALGGHGETFWLKNGNVERTMSNYDCNSREDIFAITESLFRV